MTSFGDTLASDAAQEIVKALVAGMTEAAKKIPGLWRRSGRRKEELIEAEIQRTALALQDPDNLPAVVSRQEGAWEGRLRDLLAEHPMVITELRDIVGELRGRRPNAAQLTQHVTAYTAGTAGGAMFGDVIFHYGSGPERKEPPTPANGTDASADGEETGRAHQ